jgi:hypothetical protein
VTEPERPAGAPSGSPTPEEISARLEALLKRTHALRAERAAAPQGPPLSVTWPPPDRELDGYDVVDVPEETRARTQVAPAAAAEAPAPETPAESAPAPAFTRPDWSALRLRTPPAEPPARSTWSGPLVALLALLAVAEGAYIWYLRAARPVVEDGHLRVDGPEGADVRLDGERVGTAPLDQALAPGVYDIEVGAGATIRRTPRVAIERGRTVVLLPWAESPGASDAALPPPAPVPQPPAEPLGPGTTASTGSAPAVVRDDAVSGLQVSDTTGAVDIDSTPPGLTVTMGGRPRGVTPLTLGQIRPGRHDVLVGGIVRQVEVRAGQVTTLRVTR